MIVEARISIRHRGCFSETMPPGVEVVQISSGRDADILLMHSPDETEIDRFLDFLHRTMETPAEVVDRRPGSIVARGRNPREGVVSTILAHRCTILWPAVWSGGREHYTVVAPSRAALEPLVRGMSRVGDVRVERVGDVAPESLGVNVPVSDLTSGLTERQLAVLRRAIDLGYYDSPRRTSAEALARSFGIGRSTLEEHLRKSERRVLEAFARVLATHPTLEKSANRRAGRPPRVPGKREA